MAGGSKTGDVGSMFRVYFMIGIPIMYYTADLTTISRSIMEAATIDGAGMKDQIMLIIFPVLKIRIKQLYFQCF